MLLMNYFVVDIKRDRWMPANIVKAETASQAISEAERVHKEFEHRVRRIPYVIYLMLADQLARQHNCYHRFARLERLQSGCGNLLSA